MVHRPPISLVIVLARQVYRTGRPVRPGNFSITNMVMTVGRWEGGKWSMVGGGGIHKASLMRGPVGDPPRDLIQTYRNQAEVLADTDNTPL